MDTSYLLYLTIILLSTKFFALVFKKLRLPQVAGSLVAGVLIGPLVLNLVKPTDFITTLAELGVIILMFLAGLEADIKELKKAGFACAIIATVGVIVPLIGGYLVAHTFLPMLGCETSATKVYQYVFIGVILTATSVSITVETLKELGKLTSPAGNAILGAAIIDDILGIIVLTIITSLGDPAHSSGLLSVLLHIFGFFVFTAVVGILFFIALKKITTHKHKTKRRIMIIAIAYCFFMAYAAEEWFGVADITGAFFAGLVISTLSRTAGYVTNQCETLSYSILSPVFFASIGLKVTLPQMSSILVIFSVVLILVAVITKIVSCGAAAKIFHYNNRECLQIGVGMVSRGEVALIVANKGLAAGLIAQSLIGPVIIMVIVTTILSPMLLKPTFKNVKKRR